MSRRLIAPPPFTVLIANTDRGGDQPLVVQGNPQVIRSTYTHQHFIREGRQGNTVGLVQSDPFAASAGVLNVTNAAFPSGDRIQIGKYTLVEGIHFTGTNGNAAATAVSIATAIDNLPGFTAADAGSDVNITGPSGPLRPCFKVTNQLSPGNLDTDGGAGTGSLEGGAPEAGPPLIT